MMHANIKNFWNGGVEFSVQIYRHTMDMIGFLGAPKLPTPFRKFLDISMETLFLGGGLPGTWATRTFLVLRRT